MKLFYAFVILTGMTSVALLVHAQNVMPELFAPGIISGPVNDAAPTGATNIWSVPLDQWLRNQ